MSKPSATQESEIGMPCAHPQAAEIVEAALSAAQDVVAPAADPSPRPALSVCVAEACEPPDPEAELRNLIQKWPTMPREIQRAIADLVTQGQTGSPDATS
jgi:hypothetical protein